MLKVGSALPRPVPVNSRRPVSTPEAVSSLCDPHRFARKMEAAYRSMWRRWCEADRESDGSRSKVNP